jgi:hypothetical protein
MADIKGIEVTGETYGIEDSAGRVATQVAQSTASNAKNKADDIESALEIKNLEVSLSEKFKLQTSDLPVYAMQFGKILYISAILECIQSGTSSGDIIFTIPQLKNARILKTLSGVVISNDSRQAGSLIVPITSNDAPFRVQAGFFIPEEGQIITISGCIVLD